MEIAFGKKVSPAFKKKVIQISTDLKINPDFLMAAMAFETGETFSPSIKNGAGSGAVGLIQFMPSTAQSLGTSTEDLAGMTAVKQLDYVKKYFKSRTGKLHTLSDLYMAILWPGAIGEPEGWVLFDKNDAAHPKRYVQNSGLDFDHNGKITKGEATAKVSGKLTKGRLPEYFG